MEQNFPTLVLVYWIAKYIQCTSKYLPKQTCLVLANFVSVHYTRNTSYQIIIAASMLALTVKTQANHFRMSNHPAKVKCKEKGSNWKPIHMFPWVPQQP